LSSLLLCCHGSPKGYALPSFKKKTTTKTKKQHIFVKATEVPWEIRKF
jgi:hypothetical protein